MDVPTEDKSCRYSIGEFGVKILDENVASGGTVGGRGVEEIEIDPCLREQGTNWWSWALLCYPSRAKRQKQAHT
jgi:hypothetical protein